MHMGYLLLIFAIFYQHLLFYFKTNCLIQ